MCVMGLIRLSTRGVKRLSGIVSIIRSSATDLPQFERRELAQCLLTAGQADHKPTLQR